MSGVFSGADFYKLSRVLMGFAVSLAVTACASDGVRYAPPPPWSSAQQQYNQTFAHQSATSGQSGDWGRQSASGGLPANGSAWQQSGSDATGSIPAQAAPQTVYAQPLPPVSQAAPIAPIPTRPAAPAAQWTPPSAPPPQWQPPVAQARPQALPKENPSLAPRRTESAEYGETIVVEQGQSLAGIARKYAVKPEDLMRLNDLAHPNAIYVGQKLKLPKGAKTKLPVAWTQPAASPATSPAAPRPAIHQVRAGDTLTSIAAQYRLDPDQLARLNNLGPSDRPRIGQKLALTATAGGQAPQNSGDQQPTATLSPQLPQLKRGQPAAEQKQPEQRRVVEAKPAEAQKAALAEDDVKSANPAPQVDFRWPVRGRVIAKFGPQPNGGNVDGIQIAVPQGTPVHAAEAGTVVYAGSELKPYGNLILIRHAGGWVTAYAHNADVAVKSGDQVKRGQVVSHAGQTGNVTQPQVHFEIRKGKVPVDPMEHLSGG